VTRLVLVGEAPGAVSIRHRPELALTGSTGRNIARLTQVGWAEYLRHTDRRNLFYDPQDPWPTAKARDAARSLEPTLDGLWVVLLGARVADAFGLGGLPHYEWMDAEWPASRAVVALAPHPSGRNRVLNDPTERARFGVFMRAAILGRR
jgi:hypothetical protein